MQKQEFEERIERTVTDEQYKVIEEVYMWHPSIRKTSGKQRVSHGLVPGGIITTASGSPEVQRYG